MKLAELERGDRVQWTYTVGRPPLVGTVYKVTGTTIVFTWDSGPTLDTWNRSTNVPSLERC